MNRTHAYVCTFVSLLLITSAPAGLARPAARGASLTPSRMVARGASRGSEARRAGVAAEPVRPNELAGRSNYFVGADPRAWHTDVPNYAGVRYGDIYPGIDLVYYGNQSQLEYDFVVAPGADPSSVAIRFGGASKVRV